MSDRVVPIDLRPTASGRSSSVGVFVEGCRAEHDLPGFEFEIKPEGTFLAIRRKDRLGVVTGISSSGRQASGVQVGLHLGHQLG